MRVNCHPGYMVAEFTIEDALFLRFIWAVRGAQPVDGNGRGLDALKTR